MSVIQSLSVSSVKFSCSSHPIILARTLTCIWMWNSSKLFILIKIMISGGISPCFSYPLPCLSNPPFKISNDNASMPSRLSQQQKFQLISLSLGKWRSAAHHYYAMHRRLQISPPDSLCFRGYSLRQLISEHPSDNRSPSQFSVLLTLMVLSSAPEPNLHISPPLSHLWLTIRCCTTVASFFIVESHTASSLLALP